MSAFHPLQPQKTHSDHKPRDMAINGARRRWLHLVPQRGPQAVGQAIEKSTGVCQQLTGSVQVR